MPSVDGSQVFEEVVDSFHDLRRVRVTIFDRMRLDRPQIFGSLDVSDHGERASDAMGAIPDLGGELVGSRTPVPGPDATDQRLEIGNYGVAMSVPHVA
jgi:hypothetical protein